MNSPTCSARSPRRGLDGWLLYDFHGQNPPRVTRARARRAHAHAALVLPRARGRGAGRCSCTRSSSARSPARSRAGASGTPRGLASRGARAPARRRSRAARVAMEYFPDGAIPYLVARRRRDARAGARPRRRGGRPPASSCSASSAAGTTAQVASHRRARLAHRRAKDAAFARDRRALRAGRGPPRDRRAALPHGPIRARPASRPTTRRSSAVNGHAGDPHYEPSGGPPTPIGAGDLVLIDLWARGNGPRDVYADITWVGYCGDSPPERLRGIFDVTADARDVGLATRASGRTARGATLAGLGGGSRRARPHRRGRASASGSSTAPATPSARSRPRRRREPRRPRDARRRARSCPGSASRSSRASTCPRRGSACGARSTCSSPATGRRSSRKIQRELVLIR